LTTWNGDVTNGNLGSISARRSEFATAAGGETDLEPLLNDLRVLLLFVAVYQPRLRAVRTTALNPRPVLAAGANLSDLRARLTSTTHIPLVAKTPIEIGADPNLLDQLYESVNAQRSSRTCKRGVHSAHRSLHPGRTRGITAAWGDRVCADCAAGSSPWRWLASWPSPRRSRC
jgi:hypothetical protein